MAASTHILVAILLIAASPTLNAQERCSYMTAIPREERPDNLPDIEWEGGWGNRPLIPADDRDDLCMDEYYPGTTTSGTQVIFMEEEIEGDIAIAKLNYQGTATPEIALPFMSGSFNNLGPAIRRVDDEWVLYITQRQDFESPGMQSYMFNVRIEGEPLQAAVSLQIVNIDDNAPMIQAVDRCVVPELGEPRLTECVYVVSDADGEISTRFMRFDITSDRVTDLEIFYIVGGDISTDWRTMTMTVGINQALDFEFNPLHIFQVTAFDSLPNTHTVTLMVQVDNVEHRPPRWLETFAVQQFVEKSPQFFPMRAIDGDTGINKAIYYRIVAEDPFFRIETIEGGCNGAILHVDPIDRDYLQREIFRLTVIAYKFDNESLYIETPIVIIVDDINDQIPEPLQDEYRVSIDEETPLTLNFEDDFGFHDRDLGEHAQYRVHLESVFPPGAEDAFYIAPEVGYQRQTFVMGTLNHSMLDYEEPDFQHIHLRVIATDMNNTDFVGVANVYIDLINWNDEVPIFELATQNVSFDETEGAGFFVANVRAHDRDIDDWVRHSLMGNAMDYLTIDEDTGDIHVLLDDAFDYHRQNQLFVQVRADDTLMEPYHTTTSQLVIELEDVNNTPPTLRLPRGSPQVEENVPEGFEVTSDDHLIRATDPDTTASLRFEIDWETSYATKVGETHPSEYHGCVHIETYQDPDVTGSVVGRLYAKEIREDVTIDFEMFEMLYLTIRVRDLNTVIGEDYDEATMAITIIDMNDNPPVWTTSSLEAEFRVREMSASGTAVGSVLATDIDGPLYNQVRYTIKPREDTPEGLVEIDFDSGQISVDANAAIDADVPPRWNLYYTVTASDCCFAEPCPPDTNCHNTDLEMAISIIDINNKVPEPDFERFDTTVYIYEDAVSGDHVLQMHGMDLDRDEMYHEVSYQINYAVNTRIRDFFEVDRETGLIYVHYTGPDVLDRDRGEPTHTIFVQYIDNFFSLGDGNRNQNPVDMEVLVVLLDVNDNAPELPPPDSLRWSISEGLAADVRILPEIYAPDIDEPDTPNSQVGYAILSLTVRNRDIEVPELFNMINIDYKTGELETAMALQSYWGTYDILIEAYDHGVPQMKSTETYELVINPYNFHSPQFVFPIHETTIRLSGEWAIAGLILRTVDNENLDSVAATDEDGLEAGVVTFAVTGNAEAVQYFEILNQGNNAGMLQLRQDVTEQIREFQVTITATDGGTDPSPLSTEATVRVVFVPTTGDPVFSTDTVCDVAFFELEAGLSETSELPQAFDPKNHLCVENCHSIYYRIIDGNDAGHFVLDATTNVLSLARALVREEGDTLTLAVAASNSPAETTPQPGSTLTCTVTVREADPRPRFERELYTAGISTGDLINRELLTVHATHSEGVAITYTIDMDSIEVHPSLELVKRIAFVLQPQSGLLVLNIQPTAAMQGMFEFDVVATDTANESDTTEVKIYLISALNRIFFIFLNTVEHVEANRDFIAQTLSSGFGMTCNIDQVVPASDQNGVASDSRTEVRAHFILNDIPVNADVIEELRSDTETLISIRNVLLANMIVLQDFVTEASPEVAVDVNQITVYVLAALAGILGLMVMVLLLTLFIRTRRLNRQMAALSTKRFGSIDSGLNRAALAAPGTNQFAMGTNPVWNEDTRAPNFDALSDSSGDSDLIGIEDLPQFMNDYFPDENDLPNGMPQPSTSRDAMPNHDNNFGFNASPFNPGFANGQSSSRY